MTSAKDPKYKAIYEQILTDIQNGSFLPGEQLPVETELAEKYEVSRNTLRQALLLLSKNGYIANHQGKGTFVLKNSPDDLNSYEKVCNPMLSFAKKEINDTEIDYEILKASKELQEIFHIDSSKLLINIKLNYISQNQCIGSSNCIIPYEILSQNRVPLDDNQAILDFYNYMINRKDLKAKCLISVESIENCPMIRINETYKDNSLNTLMVQDLYMDPNCYEINICKQY